MAVLHNLKHRDDIIILDRSHTIFTILMLPSVNALTTYSTVDGLQLIIFSVSSIFVNSSSATASLSFLVGTYLSVHSLGIFLSLMA